MVQRVWTFLTDYSLLLVIGALIALVWANVDPHGYHRIVEHPLLFNDWVGSEVSHWAHTYGEGHGAFDPGGATRVLSAHYLVNDVLMALFFAVAAKVVWESIILRGGALRGKKAATPLFATAGGMIGPITIYLGLAAVLGSETYSAVANGWAVPTATDIAFSYLVGRLVFGAAHPAVRFLLLLAIADDAGGLIILALFYPSAALAPIWLLFSFAVTLLAFGLFNWLPRTLDRGDQARPNSTFVRRRFGVWPYVAAGLLSWYGFQEAGLHPALGLLPIVPAIPHADQPFGQVQTGHIGGSDLLNRLEHALKSPVEIVLFFFGFLNAGVELSAIGDATWLVLLGLLVGKPLGIFAFGYLAARPLRLGLPADMRLQDLVVTGCVAAIGFTVSLFVASVAFEQGPVQDAAKMGALLSFSAAVLALAAGRLLGVEKVRL